MKCERCDGLMLEDQFLDMEESFEPMWLRAWRCLNCGCVMEPKMLANRQKQMLAMPSRAADEASVLDTHPDSDTAIAA